MNDDMDASTSAIVLKAGSKQKVVTYLNKHVASSGEDLDLVTIRLWKHGLESGEREQVGTWLASKAQRAPADWADDVVDTVRTRTAVAGTKCEFSLEATDRAGNVIRQYPMVAQPPTENLSASAEGLVHLAMRQQDTMLRVMLQDREAVTSAYQQVIALQRAEIDRMVSLQEAFQRREDEARERELRLLDRERALLEKEAASDADARERADDRIDRVVDKLGEAIEAGTVELAKGAIEKVEPGKAAELIRELAPLVRNIVGE